MKPALPPLQALMEAYTSAAGIAVSMTRDRALALAELHRREMTAEDVRAIVARIKDLIRKGSPHHTEASLDFRNLMAKADAFEERALRLRKERAARKRPAGPFPATTANPDGSKTTRLVDQPPAKDPEQVAAEVRKVADDFFAKMGRPRT